MLRLRLKINLPMLPKDAIYEFDDETAMVWRIDDNGKRFEYPLRNGLSGYLNLLRMDGSKYFFKSFMVK